MALSEPQSNAVRPARDWDVLVGKFDQAEYITSGQGQDFSGLIELAKARRSEAHDRLAKLLDATEVASLLRAAQHLSVGIGAGPTLRMPIRDFAVDVLEKRDRAARRLGRHIRSLDATGGAISVARDDGPGRWLESH